MSFCNATSYLFCVCVCVCVGVCVYLCGGFNYVSLSIRSCLSACVSVSPSVCLTVSLPVCLSVRLSVFPSVRLFERPSVRLSVGRDVLPNLYSFIHRRTKEHLPVLGWGED